MQVGKRSSEKVRGSSQHSGHTLVTESSSLLRLDSVTDASSGDGVTKATERLVAAGVGGTSGTRISSSSEATEEDEGNVGGTMLPTSSNDDDDEDEDEDEDEVEGRGIEAANEDDVGGTSVPMSSNDKDDEDEDEG
jgi:hypothetical protein